MDVQNSDAYAGLALTRRIASAHLNARDRRLMTELFYGTLENRLCLDHILSLYMDRPCEESVAREILRMRETLNGLLAKHTGQPIEKIAQDTERDNFMTAEEAQAYGLVDKVIYKRQ